MLIKFNVSDPDFQSSSDQVILTCDRHEFALLQSGLGAFLRLARGASRPGDRAAITDIDMAADLELQMFKAYSKQYCIARLPEKEAK
jgi:hypothetical protein